MESRALGIIEILGLASAITVADIMLKTADVEIINIERAKGFGWITVKVSGEVAAVNAAITAGKKVGEDCNHYITHKVIPRPVESVWDVFCSGGPSGGDPAPRKLVPPTPKDPEPEKPASEPEQPKEEPAVEEAKSEPEQKAEAPVEEPAAEEVKAEPAVAEAAVKEPVTESQAQKRGRGRPRKGPQAKSVETENKKQSSPMKKKLTDEIVTGTEEQLRH